MECLACEEPGSYLCKDCIERCLYTAPLLVCPECSRPSPVGLTHLGCRRPHGVDGIFCSGSFSNPLLKLSIKELKYKNLRGAAEPLSEFLKNRLIDNFSDFLDLYKPIITPVPLYQTRAAFRGYNQSALLGQPLAGKLGLGFEEVLTRKTDTRDQTKLNREQRIENVKGAFAVQGGVSGKNYFILDDVSTTGATLKECAKVLKRNGADAVWGIALAFEELKG